MLYFWSFLLFTIGADIYALDICCKTLYEMTRYCLYTLQVRRRISGKERVPTFDSRNLSFTTHPKCNSVQRETLFSCLCYFASSRRRCGKGSTAVQLLLIGNVPVMQLRPFLQTFSSKFRNYVVPSLPIYRRQNLRRTLPHFHVYQTPDGERERVQIGVGREALGPWSLMVSIGKPRRLKS